MSDKKIPAVLVEWTEVEYEAGWGRSDRPDGISLHLSNADAQEFIKLQDASDRKANQEGGGGYWLNGQASKPKVVDVSVKEHRKLQKLKEKNVLGWRMSREESNEFRKNHP